MSRCGSLEGGVLFRQPAVEPTYVSSFRRRLESLTVAPAKEKLSFSDGFFADEPYLRLVPEKEIDRRKRKRPSFAGSICGKNNVNLFITECSSRPTKVRLQHQVSCNISDDEDLKSEILVDFSGSSLARTRPSSSKLQSKKAELSYPTKLSPQEKTTSCESNKHMGGTRFAEDDHVDVRWMYLSHQDKMSGLYMLEQLYPGYKIGILRQDLPLYGVCLVKVDNLVALKSVSNLMGSCEWHSCSNSYFQQLPNSSWTYPEREEADAHKHIRGSNFFDNNDVSNFILPGSSPEGDTRWPQNVKIDHACAKTTQDLSSSKGVGKVSLVNSNVENDWPAVLHLEWKAATSWFLDKLHYYTMQHVKEYLIDEGISWHFQIWRPLVKQPRTVCSCSLAGSEETHSAVLSDRFMHQGLLPLRIPEAGTLNYPAKVYVGLTGDSIPTGFEELIVAVARFDPPQKNTLQTEQCEEKFAGSGKIDFLSNTGVHMCSQKDGEEKKSSLFHAIQVNHMTMSSELSNVDIDLVAESSSSMSGRSDVDILAFSLSEQRGGTLSDPVKNIVSTLLEPSLSSNCRNSQESFESSVHQMKNSPESSQLEVLEIVYDELQKSVLKSYCRYVFDAFISEHVTKVVRKRVGPERNKGLQSCKDVDAISNSCGLSYRAGCETRHTVRGPSHCMSKVIYGDPNRRMDRGTRKESTQQEAVSNMADFFGQNRFVDGGRDFDCLSRHFVSTDSLRGSANRQDQVTGSAEKLLPSLKLVEEMLSDLNKSEQTIDILKSSSDSSSSYVDQSTGACYQMPQRFHDSSKMMQLDEEVQVLTQQIHPVAPAAELKGFGMDKRVHMDEKVQISPNRRKGRTKSLRKLIQCIPRIKSEEVSKELSKKRSYTSITKVDSFSDIQDAYSVQLSSYGCARCSVDGREWHRGLLKPQPKEQTQAQSNIAFQVDQNCRVKDTKTHVVGVQSSSQTARMTRVQMRKLAAGLESLNMLKLIQLKARRKKLKVQKSNIHVWGVFALESIESGDFVVEYIGEVIRSKVSDVREHQYEKMGIGSSYLFRIDNEHVVDATKRGGIARFINHSCNPNCYTKIVTLDGQKKVFIYSKKCILAGEELTYDYKFPLEEKKIPCNCGSTKCRGSLN